MFSRPAGTGKNKNSAGRPAVTNASSKLETATAWESINFRRNSSTSSSFLLRMSTKSKAINGGLHSTSHDDDRTEPYPPPAVGAASCGQLVQAEACAAARSMAMSRWWREREEGREKAFTMPAMAAAAPTLLVWPPSQPMCPTCCTSVGYPITSSRSSSSSSSSSPSYAANICDRLRIPFISLDTPAATSPGVAFTASPPAPSSDEPAAGTALSALHTYVRTTEL